MKHSVILISCLIVSALVAFYDRLPLPDGGLFKLTKYTPWLLEFPTYVGLLFTPKNMHGLNPWGLGLGFFLQSVAVVYAFWALGRLVVKRLMRVDG
jgi:hypothetical protein